MSSTPGIDHPLILVRDIEAARAFYGRLGFNPTPVGLHPWGTSTSLAVMDRSSLELMGVYDEGLLDTYGTGDFRFGRHMHDALAEREGLSLVALHSGDAAGDRAAMEARGIISQGHIGFRRRVRPPGRDWDEAVVSLEILRDPALPRASHFICQQHRPDLIWVPEWMQHPNGATGVAALTYLASDPEPLLRRLAAMFGDGATQVMPGGWEVATGRGVFRVLRSEAWHDAFGVAPRPEVAPGQSAGVAVDVSVPDLTAVRDLLAARGIAACDTPGGLAVEDVAACGNTLLRFVRGMAG